MDGTPKETLGQIRARRERLRECVQLPAIGTCLPWVDPTLFNAESLIATIVEADPAAWPKKEATTSEEYHRPDKRVPLPLLCRSVAHDGTPACSPRPGQTLRLDELLGQGYDTPSFVFKCSVLPGGHPVVVKMLTDQNDKLPAGTYIPQEVYANHARWELPGLGMSANMEICNEADRFKDLQTLQGSYVPYSYGFYEFLLPDGYSVPAHIMEYVPTCDIQRFFVEACAPKSVSVDVFLTALHRAYIELHRNGVVHYDAAIRNLCLLPTEERRLQFVVLDFTGACSLAYEVETGMDWAETEKALLYQLFIELGEQTVVNWLESENGRRLDRLCGMTPEELAINDPV